MNSDWLDIDVLEDYLDGKLDAKAMHFVERQALDDPFVAEALAGLSQSPKRKQTLSILQKQLHDRISEKPIKRKMWGLTTQRLSIAATATVAFIAVSILFFMRETNRRNAEMATRKSNGVIVNLDTNAVLAGGINERKDTIKADETPQAALIDKAILDAKTGALAKNSKKGPVIKQSEQIFATPASEENTITAKREISSFRSLDSNQALLNKASIASVQSLNASQIVFVGNVVEQGSGKPVSGAVVRLGNSKNITATNADGSFVLPADSNTKDRNLTVNAIGFKEVPVVGMQDPNAIRNALTGNKTLQEIALITNSNGRKKENIQAPKITLKAEQNLNGKSAENITKPIPVSTINYTEYLISNNKLYRAAGPEQYVIVSFKVKKNGRPSNISVIKSLNDKADAEAKRLIQNGPDWVLPKKGTNIVELSIRF